MQDPKVKEILMWRKRFLEDSLYYDALEEKKFERFFVGMPFGIEDPEQVLEEHHEHYRKTKAE